MSDHLASFLEQIQLLPGVTAENLNDFAGLLHKIEVKRSQELFSPQQATDLVYILEKGEVTLMYKHYTKDLIIDVLKPGAVFGNLDLENVTPSYLAVSTEDSTLYTVSKNVFWQELKHYPDALLHMVQVLNERVRNYEEKMKSLVYDAKEKILHHMEILEGRKHKYMKTFLLGNIMSRMARVTHERLSHFTGLSRETVTRAIQDLKKEGKIVMDSDGKIMLNCEDCIGESKR